MSTRLPRFAPPSRGSSRVEAAEAILARVSDGPRRAAGRGIVEGGCEQGARMTTPPRRGSPARSSSAGWPRPEPPEAGLTDGRRTGSWAAPRLPRGRRADGRRDRHDRGRPDPVSPQPRDRDVPL